MIHPAKYDPDEGVYLPTPEEIAAACLAIQKTWSDDERIRRRELRPKSIPTDPEQIRRDAEALLETRLVKTKRNEVAELVQVRREPTAGSWQLETYSLD